MAAKPTLTQIPDDGFSLAYSAESGDLRFNIMAFFAVIAIAFYLYTGYDALLAFAVATGCAAYYFYPLIEKKPRIGANQYGVFIDGFGLIAWRAIGDVGLSTYATRLLETTELQLRLVQPLDNALLVDWRKMPIWRVLMKLPWSMTYDNVVRISLEPFAPPPEEVHRTFVRMKKFYGSRN
ncbi:MAG: hypothetical protein SGJ17_04120 [Hyphomicrobiales bacterium]|nr:hypothetical protein [Hyphomicrobiales bacterium]